MWRFALVLLAVLAIPVAEAGACSCVTASPAERLADAGAAFIGVATAVEREGMHERTTFRVEEPVKGDIAGEVVVRTGDGSSCSLFMRVGQRLGLLLHHDGTGWAANSCSTMTPDELRAADRSAPLPGRGHAALFAVGDFDGARLLAFDASGRPLAVGRGAGRAHAVAACPRHDRLVEAYRAGGRTWLGVRRADTLRQLRRTPLPLSGAVELWCGDPRGRTVAAVRAGGGRVDVRRLRGGGWTRIFGGRAAGHALTRRGLFLARGGEVLRIGLRTGATRRIGASHGMRGPLAPSPDGRRVAGVAGERLVIAGRGGRSVPTAGGRPFWLGDGGIAIVPAAGPIERFGPDLLPRPLLEGFGGARRLTAAGDLAWAVGDAGELLRRPLTGGAIGTPATIAGDVAALAAFAPAVALSDAPVARTAALCSQPAPGTSSPDS